MSLILDALRKADAERERGAVPSLHSHPVEPASEETSPQPRTRLNLLWIAIGAAVGLLGAAATWVIVGRSAPPAMQTAARVEPAAAPQAPAVAVAQPPPAPAAAPADAPVAEPAPWRPPVPPESPKAGARPETRSDAPVAVLGNVPPAPPQIYARDQLPPDIRAQLPQITIGGSIYSPNPSGRSLIVNGQLFRERDRLTPDLALEEIRLKAAVFSFRGYRFEVLF